LAGAAGAAVLRAVFGSTVDAGRVQAGLLAVGCTVAIVNLVLMVGALAHERPAGVAVAWGVAVLAGAGSLVALGALSPVDRSTTAFVVTELVATAALGAVAVRALRGSREARA
jgi:hypothetical protein